MAYFLNDVSISIQSYFEGGNPLQVQLFPDPEQPEQDQLFVRLQEVDAGIGGLLNDVVDEQL